VKNIERHPATIAIGFSKMARSPNGRRWKHTQPPARLRGRAWCLEVAELCRTRATRLHRKPCTLVAH